MNIQNAKFEDVKPVSVERQQQYAEAHMAGKAHLLESSPSVKLNLPMKKVSLKEFLAINKRSKKKQFNRTFIESKFLKAVKKANKIRRHELLNLSLLVEAVMTHNYRQMQQCETHYRCVVTYSEKDCAIFDMSIEDYEALDAIAGQKLAA